MLSALRREISMDRFDLMKILIGTPDENDYQNKDVIIQGITGSFGSTHTRLMKGYGTNISAGVTPGKGGTTFDGIPVFDNMKDAVALTGSRITGIFVPAPSFLSAGKEALESGIKLIVAIPEHVPVRDSIELFELARKNNAKMIGPNTPGVILPNIMKIGIMPGQPFTKGNTVVLSRSGTLMYEVSYNLSKAGYGQRLCFGIGGDPINGTNLIEAIDMVRHYDDIDSVVVVGEIGGDAEEQFAEHLLKIGFDKPVIAYIAGRSAPKEKTMGHAGAIVYGNYGSAESKFSSLQDAHIPVAKSPAEVPTLLRGELRR
jgi:succinyl-CoA synthetase alpha subunit